MIDCHTSQRYSRVVEITFSSYTVVSKINDVESGDYIGDF